MLIPIVYPALRMDCVGYELLFQKWVTHQGSKKHEGSLKNKELYFANAIQHNAEIGSMQHETCFMVTELDLPFASASLVFQGKMS